MEAVMDKVELMSPASSFEALKAAVRNGADAVYLGGKQFNARQGAENFTGEEIKAAIEYAHERDCKIYATVNVLIADSEMERALEFIYFLAENRVDGIILQDMGLAHLCRRFFPSLPLMASTQMTVTGAQGARFLQERGFKRAILARELSLEEIRAIARQVEIELEVFVHGALCFSYSGQCLLSSLVGGRSGNRGMCAQPCRLPYTLVDPRGRPVGEEKYLLSMRDLCALPLLPHLIEAGVKAFKIEGRMRRPEYVAVVTRIYREAIDRYYGDPQNFQVTPEELQKLAQIFNRDFTAGYLEGKVGKNLMSYGRPSNRGLYLGRIIDKKDGLRELKLELPLRKGDGLEVWISRGREGLVVERFYRDGEEIEEAHPGDRIWLPLPGSARVGDRVFKTSDVQLLSQARQSFTSPREGDLIPLKMRVRGRLGEPLILEVEDPQGHKVRLASQVVPEKAGLHPLSHQVLVHQLGRLGNTPYFLEHLEAELEGDLMVPLSELNRLRREALARLKEMRLSSYPSRLSSTWPWEKISKSLALKSNPPSSSKLPRLSAAVAGIEAAWAALRAGAERVYIAGEQGGSFPSGDGWREFLREARKRKREVIPGLPRVWQEGETARILSRIEEWRSLGAKMFLAGNLEGIKLLRDRGLEVWGDYTLNVFNSWAVEYWAQMGLAGLTVSPEMRKDQWEGVSKVLPLETMVHGSFPLMISKACVLGARLGGKNGACSAPCRQGSWKLKDRMGFLFPCATDEFCRFYIYNSKELCLLDYLPEIAHMGFAWIRLELRGKPALYVEMVTSLYREALDCLERAQGERILVLSREIKRLIPEGITRGHYFRGVIDGGEELDQAGVE